MTTTTSYSDQFRFRQMIGFTLRKNRGFTIYYCIISFILFPLQYIFKITNDYYIAHNSFYFQGLSEIYGEVTVMLLPALVIVASLILTIILFSYMHSKKAVDLFHAIPVKREKLMLANIIAAAIIIVVPLFVWYLLTTIIKTCYFGITTQIVLTILNDFACLSITALFTIVFTAFISSNMGTIFDTFLFTSGLAVSVPLMLLSIKTVLDTYLFGFPSNTLLADSNIALTSPWSAIYLRLSLWKEQDERVASINIAFLIWLALTIIFLFLALHAYKNRKSEMAEQTDSKGIIKNISKVIVSFLGSVVFGFMFNAYTVRENKVIFVIGAIFGAAVIYFVTEAILMRGVKNFKKSLVPGIVVVGAIGIFSVIMTSGFFGYETKVPNINQVQSVTIDYIGRGQLAEIVSVGDAYEIEQQNSKTTVYPNIRNVTLTGEQAKALIIKLHQQIVENKDVPTSDDPTLSIDISYTLSNGITMHRQYHYTNIGEAGVDCLQQLEATEEFKTQVFSVFSMPASSIRSITISNRFQESEEKLPITTDFANKLNEALKQDIKNESMEEIFTPTLSPVGYLTLDYTISQNMQGKAFQSNTILITSGYTNTLRVLAEFDYLQYLEYNVENIEQIVVAPLDPYYSRYNYFFSFNMIADSIEYGTSYAYDTGYTIKDKEIMQQLLAHSYNYYDTTSAQVYVINIYFNSQEVYAQQVKQVLILEKDLPEEIRTELEEQVQMFYD